MAAENVADWLPRDEVIDPVTRLMSHGMKLREFIPDGRTLPSSILALMEWWMDTTYTLHLPFDKMTITLVDFIAITRLHFGGRSVAFDDQLRTLDLLACERASGQLSGWSPPSRIKGFVVRVSSLTTRICSRSVWELDADVVAQAFLFYLLLTTLFINHGNYADLALPPPL
ncbi:hypothetical protein JCGZ_12675 [Jatropha curcas]|uniref:Aminotransferase-like plant mobile domain-containing protein n=1 Tax=Jatropha curcas TaxID=180498 RepID=A0A067KDZ6_JATCU|nr:hypothetical protein JCGZ_12675 [Jatropha curcas]